jgi:16S rRNA (cytidine1402-2'-O)-methyltransferase
METTANSGTTQIFMETPFRNQKFLDELLRQCSDTTRLCIACDLTLPTQYIRTRRIADWKKDKPDIHKRYCIFLMG